MEHQWKMALIGGVVTAITTAAIFVISFRFPLYEFKMFVFESTGQWFFGNPLTQLRLYGGIPGAFVAGYFARDDFGQVDKWVSLKIGLYAAFLGIVFLVVAIMLYNVFMSTVVDGMFPPPFYLILVTPLILAFPLLPAYLVEGLLFGYVGGIIQESKVTGT